jgi:pimeloyl-ACP methyl ester carboxylesterase
MSPSREVTVAGRTVAYAQYGAVGGVPAVLLPGSPGGRLSRPLDDGLYDRLGLSVLVPDRPGYGASTPNAGRRVVDVALDLLAVLDAESVDSAVVLGGSGGGPHALALAAAAPDRVRSVAVAVGAAPLQPEERDQQVATNRAIMRLAHDRAALIEHLTPLRDTLLTAGVQALFPDSTEHERERMMVAAERNAEMLGAALEPGVQGWADDYHALWGQDWGFRVEDVDVPVVWGHGEADTLVPIAAARRLAARLPRCRFVSWPGEGHALSPARTTELWASALAGAVTA